MFTVVFDFLKTHLAIIITLIATIPIPIISLVLKNRRSKETNRINRIINSDKYKVYQSSKNEILKLKTIIEEYKNRHKFDIQYFKELQKKPEYLIILSYIGDDDRLIFKRNISILGSDLILPDNEIYEIVGQIDEIIIRELLMKYDDEKELPLGTTIIDRFSEEKAFLYQMKHAKYKDWGNRFGSDLKGGCFDQPWLEFINNGFTNWLSAIIACQLKPYSEYKLKKIEGVGQVPLYIVNTDPIRLFINYLVHECEIIHPDVLLYYGVIWDDNKLIDRALKHGADFTIKPKDLAERYRTEYNWFLKTTNCKKETKRNNTEINFYGARTN